MSKYKMDLQKIPKSRKSQVGETLTWTVATIVIFILIVLFVSATAFLSKDKKAILGIGGSVEDTESVFADEQTLLAILEKDNGKIKNLIEEGKLNEAKTEMDKVLADVEKKGLLCDIWAIPDKGIIYKFKTEPRISFDIANLEILNVKDITLQMSCEAKQTK